MPELTPELRELLTKHHYVVVGRHSAVKTCHWTKRSIREGPGQVCYKQKFYGIESHRCLQMTPAVGWCDHQCLLCWRPVEHTLGGDMDEDVDEPKDIVDGAIAAQRKLLIGFKGLDEVDKERLDEAFSPRNAAISLAGEPTLYHRIDDLIFEFHNRGITTFLVTNGTRPDRLPTFTEPTQLYISLDAPDRERYLAMDRPMNASSWDRLNESLEKLPSFRCRTVIRLTLVKGHNMTNPEGYAKLIKKAEPKYIECKAYMHVGFSRKRLPREAMPSHQEVKDFAKRLAKATGYEITDEQEPSRVVLLS